LLPAAVPALRWLMLPPTIVVVASGPTGDRKRPARAASSSMVVKDEAQGGLSECGGSGHGWQGVWVNSEDDLRGAAGDNRDFALVRTLELAGRLSGRAGPLPVYLPAGLSSSAGDTEPEGLCVTRRWIDLRADRRG
jgi:hypothetical protein